MLLSSRISDCPCLTHGAAAGPQLRLVEAVQERLGGLVQEAQETVTHVVVVTVAQVDQAVALDRGLLAQQQVQLPADTSEAWLRALV